MGIWWTDCIRASGTVGLTVTSQPLCTSILQVFPGTSAFFWVDEVPPVFPWSHKSCPDKSRESWARGCSRSNFWLCSKRMDRLSPWARCCSGLFSIWSCLRAKKKIFKAANPCPGTGSCCLLLSGLEGSSVWPDKNPWTQLWLPPGNHGLSCGCSLQERSGSSSWLGQWWGLDWHPQCLNWITRTCHLKIISYDLQSYYYLPYHCSTVYVFGRFTCFLQGQTHSLFSLTKGQNCPP